MYIRWSDVLEDIHLSHSGLHSGWGVLLIRDVLEEQGCAQGPKGWPAARLPGPSFPYCPMGTAACCGCLDINLDDVSARKGGMFEHPMPPPSPLLLWCSAFKLEASFQGLCVLRIITYKMLSLPETIWLQKMTHLD